MENPEESFRERMDEVRQDLTELQKLHKGGKDRNSAEVRELEDKIRSALDVPQECWVPAGESLNELVENLHQQLNLLEDSSLSHPGNVPDEDVLRSASGGLALQGVYCTGILENMLEKREQLIEVPEGFSLHRPQHSSLYEKEAFSSCTSLTFFQKVVEKLGYTFSISAKVRFKVFTVENTTEKSHCTKEQGKSHTSSSEESCVWKTMYSYVPLASSFIQKDKLKLSSAAMKDLRDIEAVLINSDEGDMTPELLDRVGEFFKRFGSHADQGPLHFGGVFWWKASAQGFSSSEVRQMNSLISEALHLYVGAGYSKLTSLCSPKESNVAGIRKHFLLLKKFFFSITAPKSEVSVSASQLKGSFTGSYSEAQMSRVKLSVSKTGGPAETNNHLQWKCALVSSNRTWQVIDRGTSLIPVWDIILSAHTQDFTDPFRLSSSLLEAYRRITGQDADLMLTHIVNKMKMEDFTNLLQKLGIKSVYSSKIEKSEVLVIDSLSLSAKKPTTETQLCSYYLYKLMTLDYSARFFVLKLTDNEFKKSSPDNQCSSKNKRSDFFSVEQEEDEEDNKLDSYIHPMDVHMAVFHCSGDFLRAFLFNKLSTCQFALPLLVPSPETGAVELPLWALRQVKRSWCSKELSVRGSSVKHNCRDMFNTPVPTVSFIRLGSSSISKSQILNSVISPKRHSVFFHRHCRGSSPDCLLMDGVVEIAWYCPGGRKDDVFDSCIAFLNLHGDASQHPEQLQFLQEVSTVNVLLIPESPLVGEEKKKAEALSNSPVPLICLFAGQSKVSPGNNPTKVRLAAKNRSEGNLTDEISSHIKHCISTVNKTSSLQTYLQAARQQQFRVDEESEFCTEGKEKAKILLNLLKEERLSTLKETLLPLQGELWHRWCMKDKEQYRLNSKANKSIEQQMSEIRAEKTALRHEQLKRAFPLHDFTRSFLECLTSADPQDTKLFMLHWLGMYLDELTADTLNELQEKYHSTWTTLRLKDKSKDKDQEIKLQKDLNTISKQISAATLGLQHLMRETAQLYEAGQSGESLKNQRQFLSVLPAVGAEMLMSGHPLELMDGDAAHVPLVWIEAVLDKLTERLGDRKVFVLSVLGVQSSGKSTLLNTMFGLQFTVSAGRCTRGAFMQLVRVSEEVRAQLQYDFVLVVDTEGLRSPELSNKTSLSHDNELATLIIGIGDMTLINIMGENPSEMQDILQICVQAFLRMTSVQIKPSCIFVHQNVAEASANDKNMEGRRCLLEKLDEMARIAATEEKHEVTGFSDIIQFDVESQVFYFKNLLEGDPPMAPPNPSYSQNVQELKMKLLSVAQWQPRVKFPSLSEFKLRIRDVWNALLGENFVFSFRNTLEMLVYSKLEEKYGEWSWKMRKRALEIQNRLSNQINNNIVQAVTLSDLMREFNGVYSTLTAEIEKYFKEEKKQEILINWKVNVDKRFEILRNELTEETRKQSNELIRLKKFRLELDRKKSEYESELIKMSKDLASRLKEQKLSDKKVEEQFDRLWKSWVTRVSSELPPEEPLDIRATVQNILLEKFKNQGDVLNKIVNREEMFQFNKKKHIKQSWARSVWNTVTSQDPQCGFHGNELTQHIQRAVNKYIDRREGEKVDFNENFIHEILGLIKSNITDYEKSTEQNIFTKEYEFELSVYLCFTAAPQFEKLHTAFRRANNPLIYLESKRDQYLDSFKSFCKGATSVTFFVDFLCRCLKPAIQQAVCAKTCIQITDDMKSNCPAFSGNRSNLENHILRHLAEQEDFDSYMEYINQPKDYFERFIRERVERYCRNNSDQLRVMFNTNLTDLVQQVITVNTTVTAAVRERHGGATLWLDDFCVALSDHMELPRQDFRNIENEDITDLKFLRETMDRSLEEILENLQKESSSKPDLDLKMFRLRPDEILCEALSGCWEQCPFCKAICTNTIPGHETDHSVQFHRSKALAGWHRCGTDEFSVDFCTTSVSSDKRFRPLSSSSSFPYKTYRAAGEPYSRWSITPDNSEQSYWKWFICTFRSQLEGKLKLKFEGSGEIPDEWKTIEKRK